MDIAILITLGGNIILLIIRIIADITLKAKDVKRVKIEMREKNLVAAFENIYNQMKYIQHNLSLSDDIAKQTSQITKLKKTLNLQGLYLNKRAKNIISDFCDYAINRIGGCERDITRENTIFIDFEDEFKR